MSFSFSHHKLSFQTGGGPGKPLPSFQISYEFSLYNSQQCLLLLLLIIIIIISLMELGHLLTRPGITYPEISSKVRHNSFCQLGNSVSLPWVIYYEAFYLHVLSSFSYIPVICPKLVLFLIPLRFVHLFCKLTL